MRTFSGNRQTNGIVKTVKRSPGGPLVEVTLAAQPQVRGCSLAANTRAHSSGRAAFIHPQWTSGRHGAHPCPGPEEEPQTCS